MPTPATLPVCTSDENTDAYKDHLPVAISRYSTGPWRTLEQPLGLVAQSFFYAPTMALDDAPTTPHCRPARTRPYTGIGKHYCAPQTVVCLATLATSSIPLYLTYGRLDGQQYPAMVARGQLFSLHKLVKDLLAAAPKWLMISEELRATLMNRYQLSAKPCLVVHNPSPVQDTANSSWPFAGDGFSRQPPTSNHQLVYAGFIWPMHADALIAVQKSRAPVAAARQKGVPIALVYQPGSLGTINEKMNFPGRVFFFGLEALYRDAALPAAGLAIVVYGQLC